MKCFYHPETDGVGVCQQCGKFCCKQCIQEVAGTMLCKGCMERARQSQVAQAQEVQQDALAEAQRLRQQAVKRIRWSWVVAILVGAVFVILGLGASGDPSASLPMPWYILAPLGAYVWWGIFWGLVWVWPGWNRRVRKFNNALSGWIIIARPFAWFMIFFFYICFYLSVPFAFAIYYGVFGGGFVQYKRHRALAAQPSTA